MAIKEHQIEVGKWQWFYRETKVESERPPVLLLHPIPTHSYTWRGVMNQLAEQKIAAIAPDWLGCGFSAKPDKRDFNYSPDAFVTALEDFIAAMELDKFYLVAQGYLGSVGIQYALRNSDKIERLVILNSPLTKQDKLPWKMKQWGLPFVGDMMTQDPLQVDRTLESGSGFVVPEKDLSVHRKPFLESSAVGRSLMAIVKNLELDKATTEISQGLVKLKTPTLILWGEEDPWLDVDEAEAIAKSNSSVDIVKLTEAKHYPQEHWPEEIAIAIFQFFRRKVL
ncbi:putative hydrolase or acyltransferase of alpha/beta superfamily [Xenococcus sp. PCC 7305]|uniref:alpha/beta fold hydrolase n=1 Tax=Xenococcus sp. PCC 7305 TaxID=102125 RepID=UPI0002ABB8FA|nr:alpha/beta fold hydrolase [Xenococcus sp. PCC 7305]ELS04730.1 putative hydrolase or acyltransferase of alpha/beta superfamily [Xenococcus sp. PCC 7305]